MRSTSILNLAFTDEGGAGIAARGFNDLLVAAGHRSILVVKESGRTSRNVVALRSKPTRFSIQNVTSKILARLERPAQAPVSPFDKKYCFYNVDENEEHYSADRILLATGFTPDVIILHWISGFLNSKSIAELESRTGARIIWLMMDNAPLTGGCHYPWSCTGYQSNCDHCPAILDPADRSIARRNLDLKKLHLPAGLRLLACSESDFLRAKSSSLFGQGHAFKYLIPVDNNRYRPGDVKQARKSFGIDPQSRVIFYGSIALTDRRKGGMLFLQALRHLHDVYETADLQKIVVLVAGRTDADMFAGLRVSVKMTGYLNEEGLVRAYQAADVFVSTSLEDSGPLMINQSVMCGTPVVSFDVGVALDLVQDGRTGYRVPTGDAKDLSRSIARVLDLPSAGHAAMREGCRALAMKLCDPETQLQRLMQILDEV